MNNQYFSIVYWPANYTYYAIGAAILANAVVMIFFGSLAISPVWLFANFAVLVFYFIGVNILSVRSTRVLQTNYSRKLFIIALFARIIFMAVIVLIADFTWERLFYVGAVDATRYHRVAWELSMLINDGNFGSILPHLLFEYEGHYDNIGVPLVLGPVYAIFGSSPIVGKVFISLIGSGSVVLVYKTTRLIWDERTARLAGIMMAFFPLALFYSSVILKEEFVVFLSLLVVYIVTKSVTENSFTLRQLVILLFALVMIFLFRTAAGALLISLIAGIYILNRFAGSYAISFFVSLFILSALFYSLEFFTELDQYYERIAEVTKYYETRVDTVQEGNSLANIVGLPVYLIISFFAPFPSMVTTSLRFDVSHDATYYWVSGLMIWNFLIYFGLVGLWKAIKTKRSQSFAVWGFAIGYSLILGVTALFTSVRFGYNVMPMFFILIAVGIKYRKEFPYWKYYLLGAVFLIFAWNYFRLAGRGIL